MNKWLFLFLSFVFILSSITKSYDMISFVVETKLFTISYLSSSLQKMSMAGAFFTCAIEMVLALIVLRNEYRKIASVVFLLLLTFFLYLTGINYLFPPVVGSVESCGCFGQLIPLTAFQSFIKSVVLWIISVVIICNVLKNSKCKWNIMKLLCDKYLYLCIAISLVLPMYSLWFFNELEHTVYICGFVALCIILTTIVVFAYRSSLRR